MNASNPRPVIGPIGSNPPAASGQAPGSPERAFANSLSAALSGSFGLPAVPVSNPGPSPVAAGLDVLPLFSGAGTGTDGLNSLLDENVFGLQASLSSVDPGAPGNLFGPIALDLGAGQPLTGSQPALPEKIEAPTQVPASNLAKALLQPETALVSPLPTPSFPLKTADQPATGRSIIGIHAESRASMMALATVASRSTDGSAQAVQILPDLRQSLPKRTDRPGAGIIATISTEPHSQGSLVDLSKTLINLDNRPSPVQGVRPPTPQTAFVQQMAERADGSLSADRPLSNADHLAQGRQQATNAQNLASTSASAKPAASVAVQNIDAAETIGIDRQPGAEPLAILGSEIGRIDPPGGASSRPPVPPAQPPSTQIALQIARAVPQGIDRFSVQLHPADLGAVEIQLDFADDGRVSALIIAERPETLDMLQRDSRTLERSLNDTGLQLESDGLSFSLKQEQNQQGRGFDASSHRHAQAYPDDQAHGGAGDHPPGQEPVRISQQRLLDIRT